MHYGQILQSHACISSPVLPDLLFGFDSDVASATSSGRRRVPDLARQGVLMRKYGQEVIRLTAGKRVHGTGSVPGGVNKSLSVEERDYLLKDIYRVIGWAREAVHLARRLYEQNWTSTGTSAVQGARPVLDSRDGAMDSTTAACVPRHGRRHGL